jgi:hypothetical protein
VVAHDAWVGVMPRPLHDFGGLGAVIYQIAQAPDFIRCFGVGDREQRFVITVKVGDDEQFHIFPSLEPWS